MIKPDRLDCEKQTVIKALVEQIYQFLYDPLERAKELTKITGQLESLWYKIEGTAPSERYLQGYYTGRIGFEAVGWQKIFAKGATSSAHFAIKSKPLISRSLAREYIKNHLTHELGDSYGMFVKDFGNNYKLVQQIHKDGLVKVWKLLPEGVSEIIKQKQLFGYK